MTFNNLIQMIVKIREIALFTRATPGSSLVLDETAVLADPSNMKPSNRMFVPEIQTLLVVSVCMRSGLAWLSACTKPLVLRQVVPSFPIHPLLFYHHKSHSNKTRK